MDALTAAYESAADRLCGLSLDDFMAAVAGWDVHPVTVGGAVVGAVLVNGPEIHACVKREACGRWMSRRLLGVLDQVVKRYGFAVTSATTDDGVRFVQRLGFTQRADGRWCKGM